MTWGECDVRERAVEIQQVKAVNSISYEEAVKRAEGQKKM